MPRLLDLSCDACGEKVYDHFVLTVPEKVIHFGCGGTFQVEWLPRRRSDAGWSDRDSVVVFRDATGKLRYPGRNDAPTPQGCERVVMKSLREVERFEKANGVRNEAMWYDRNGRGFDDTQQRREVERDWSAFRDSF